MPAAALPPDVCLTIVAKRSFQCRRFLPSRKKIMACLAVVATDLVDCLDSDKKPDDPPPPKPSS
jgi:hypothetical protein